MKTPEIHEFLELLCDQASKETLPLFRSKMEISNKRQADFDPVTEADKNAERAIRDLILERYPDHGVFGEEHGIVNENADYQWIIDPIDGTRAFISGIPVWGTLVGLFHKGEPIAGVMDQPFTGERFLSNGLRSLLIRNNEEHVLQTSSVADTSQATMMTCDPNLFKGQELPPFQKLEGMFRLSRYSADCYAFAMVASGQIELVIETGVQLYDIAALIPIVEKAGGIFTDWEGNKNPDGGRVIAAANSDIHTAVLEILSGA